jgi:two-component system, LuxR family, response regulator TtrR
MSHVYPHPVMMKSISEKIDTSRKDRNDSVIPALRKQLSVIDCDDAIVDALKWILELNGYEVRAYARPQDFFDDRNRFPQAQCVICEASNPDMSGTELLKMLKTLGMDVPVILLATESDVSAAVAAMREGAFDYLEKPFIGSQLIKRVREATQ